MKLSIKKQTTSKRLAIFVQDSSQTDGRGLAGLAWNTGSLAWRYWREDAGNADSVAVTLCAGTRGTYVNSGGAGTGGGFIEKDATNMPGFYEISVPDAALATGAGWVVMELRGAANMAPVTIEIELTDEVSADVYNIVNHGTYGNSAIKTQTGTIETNLGTVDTVVDGIATTLGAAGVGLTNLGDTRIANLNAPVATVDTVVDGIATTLGAAGAGLTALGDVRLGNLDAAVSSRSSLTAQQVWEYATRTLSSFGTLVADVATAVWGAAARTLTAFGFTVATNSDANVTAIKAKTDLIPAAPAAVSDVPTAAQNAAAIGARAPASEVYAADGAIPTYDQFLFMIWAALAQFDISGTALSAKKLDGTTEAMAFTLDSATAPTSRVRAT